MIETKTEEVALEDTFISPENFDKARDAIGVAIALGAEIPAQVGSYIYFMTISHDFFSKSKISFNSNGQTISLGDDGYSIGFYISEEEAKKDLLTLILGRWKKKGNAPWMINQIRKDDSLSPSSEEYNNLEAEYRKTHDDDSLIKVYAAQGYKFDIQKKKITNAHLVRS